MKLSIDLAFIGHKFSVDIKRNPLARLLKKTTIKNEYHTPVVSDAERPAKNLIKFAKSNPGREVCVEWCQSLDDALFQLSGKRTWIDGNPEKTLFTGKNWRIVLEKRGVTNVKNEVVE